MKSANPLRDVKIRMKLAIGFGALIVVAAALGWLGWTRLHVIDQLSSIAAQAGNANRELLNARREEKNFAVRGFEKYGSDAKNSVEKWEESEKALQELLAALKATPVLQEDERKLVAEAIGAADQYGRAFAVGAAARTAQDKAIDAFRAIGWEVTRTIEVAANDVIKPGFAAAEKAKDASRIAHWAKIEDALKEKIVDRFLVLRTTAVYSMLSKADKEWEAYSAQLAKTMAGAAEWAQLVKQAQSDLTKAAEAIVAHLTNYEVAGKQFRKAILEGRDADALMVEKARVVGDSCDNLQTKLKGRMQATMTSATAAIITFSLVGLALGVLFAVAITRMITRPLRACVACIEAVAEGQIQSDPPTEFLDRDDEIGDMAKSLAMMTKSLREIVAGMRGNSEGLQTTSTQLSATATQLAGSAAETTTQSVQVAAAAEQLTNNMSAMSASTQEMSANFKTLVSAVEEMTASISEVARSAQHAATVVHDAASLTQVSDEKIGELGKAAEEIGKIIEVIQDIAEQTHLLALNATIEAARAGDAGKGFAVVATEVKELAKQTATATETIRQWIGGIQSSTTDAVNAINEISKAMTNVNDVSMSIASAVEEQSVTTQEIARNVSQSAVAAETVAKGVAESATVTREISKNIAQVGQAVKETAEGAKATQSTSNELTEVAGRLNSMVGQFQTAV